MRWAIGIERLIHIFTADTSPGHSGYLQFRQEHGKTLLAASLTWLKQHRAFAMIQLPRGERKRHSFFINDPEPDVPKDIIPMAQCAFEFSMFKISAVHIIYRSWLRSSSTYEPSDPPIRLNNFRFNGKIEKMVVFLAAPHRRSLILVQSTPRRERIERTTLLQHNHGHKTTVAQQCLEARRSRYGFVLSPVIDKQVERPAPGHSTVRQHSLPT